MCLFNDTEYNSIGTRYNNDRPDYKNVQKWI